uniref:Uncharacterized protein n=1 Tax=Anguilla anguilla TaxID=7936 RepID=A0A0E9TPC0_ANGAN
MPFNRSEIMNVFGFPGIIKAQIISQAITVKAM